MIEKKDSFILLSTENTSLLLYIDKIGKVESLHYGRRLHSINDAPSLLRRQSFPEGTSIVHTKDIPLVLDHLSLEYSTEGKGDFFSPSMIMRNERGTLFDFKYKDCEARTPEQINLFPTPDNGKEELVIHLSDEMMEADLYLHYIIYPCDVIGRYTVLVNKSETDLVVSRLSSMQTTITNDDYDLISFHGCWGGELQEYREQITPGEKILSSRNGLSSNRTNPLFLVVERNPGRRQKCYGFNLIYSGSHEESIEMDVFSQIRIRTGFRSESFQKILKKDESLTTPMAVTTFSENGRNGTGLNFQRFVDSCLVKERWRYKDRPICYNSWEALTFDVKEKKIVSLMKKAKALGMELFVLDDGWFKKRNNDTSSLGDWTEDKEKLPSGLGYLAKKAEEIGIQLGIWMEPEMTNADSDLYRAHPDWIIKDSIHEPSMGRNQYMLDLTKKEVRDYIVEVVLNVLSKGKISYIKWDCNRGISDRPCNTSFDYDYAVGLYDVLERITSSRPDVLFENCASGGNRFDLGMTRYFPQTWISDDTDSFQRLGMTKSAISGYPLSTLSNHVSFKVNKQTLRRTSLETKFDVAAFGVLGYELNLDDLSSIDEETIRNQISFYKKHRKTFQYGAASLLYDFKDEISSIQAQYVDKTIVGIYRRLQKASKKTEHLICENLIEDKTYHYKTRSESVPITTFGDWVNTITPIHINPEGILMSIINKKKDMKGEIDEGRCSGSLLMSTGPVLSKEWNGTGYDESTRMILDFGARMYVIEEDNEG